MLLPRRLRHLRVSYGVEEDVFHPVRAKQGMVASVDAMATQVGVDILKQGGNAVDAAVAVGYALAVTHPQAGNLGGGGFMLLRTKDGKYHGDRLPRNGASQCHPRYVPGRSGQS
ncbi:gamma-glutamyltranspeptidase [Citrobacter koseri]|uniref:Gamma-glutamyltranspeptidase n=1 Tax=Citrobacter koseri TaxID=545 RepID=A0A2X2WFP5_CITKO|nr:gamma-glutamyltranspeptidase [Citrobacter koseri]